MQENTSYHSGSHNLEIPTMQQIDCEVDAGTGFNILPLYKAREIFKQEWLSLDQPTVYIQVFGGQTVRNLGLCVVYMHTKGKIYKVRCKVTDIPSYPILSREQAKIMGLCRLPTNPAPNWYSKSKEYPHSFKTAKDSKRSLPECTKRTKYQMEWKLYWVRGQNTLQKTISSENMLMYSKE